ncbi:MAG TPA: IclR family transcriptional regulator [Steroidobacteraceae bacterium]|nr:IclR family transcriptional regulator [Steroidobacteraceae bacterium]
MAKTRRYRAPALEKGLEILEFLAPRAQPMKLSEISEGLGRSTSEIFRMMQVLEERRYLTRPPGEEGYALTNRLFLLGMEHPPVKGLVGTAMPIMHRLAAEIEQPCHLAVPSEELIVVIARVESPGDVGFLVRVGHRRPIPQSTSGLVLLAFQPEDIRVRWLETLRRRQVRYERKGLDGSLRSILARGYACIPSEVVTGVTDISAPILLEGSAIAALTVPFAERRGARGELTRCIGQLRRAAARISQELEG